MAVYENRYPLSLGFKVNPDIRYFDKGIGTVFEVQNQLATKMTVEESPIFTTVKADSTLELSDNITTEKKGETYYSFEKSDNEDAFITMQIWIEEDMDLYLYPSGTSLNEIVVWLDSEMISSGRLFLQCVYVGKVEAGQLLTVKFKMKENGESSGYVRTRMAKYDEENFKKYYEILHFCESGGFSYVNKNVKLRFEKCDMHCLKKKHCIEFVFIIVKKASNFKQEK